MKAVIALIFAASALAQVIADQAKPLPGTNPAEWGIERYLLVDRNPVPLSVPLSGRRTLILSLVDAESGLIIRAAPKELSGDDELFVHLAAKKGVRQTEALSIFVKSVNPPADRGRWWRPVGSEARILPTENLPDALLVHPRSISELFPKSGIYRLTLR